MPRKQRVPRKKFPTHGTPRGTTPQKKVIGASLLTATATRAETAARMTVAVPESEFF
ncbi:MAG: hypothetical protein M1324_00860 [Patescibacteria group bacterium]|nr:hypothetical protein [Patescibacteria group bacterium]